MTSSIKGANGLGAWFVNCCKQTYSMRTRSVVPFIDKFLCQRHITGSNFPYSRSLSLEMWL